jgi:hypothetical protein
MGYCITQRESNFFISKENFKSVVDCIHSLAKYSLVNGKFQSNFSWVSNSFIEIDDIKELFNEWRWEIDFDKEGNINSIYFLGEKLGDDNKFFASFAQFVKEESYIEMCGEDNCMWRWIFKDGKMEEKYATITWE